MALNIGYRITYSSFQSLAISVLYSMKWEFKISVWHKIFLFHTQNLFILSQCFLFYKCLILPSYFLLQHLKECYLWLMLAKSLNFQTCYTFIRNRSKPRDENEPPSFSIQTLIKMLKSVKYEHFTYKPL